MLHITGRLSLRAYRISSSTLCRLSSPSPRLISTLAVLEQRDGKLKGGSLCAVTAAKALGGSVTGFIAGGNVKSVADQAAKANGVEKVVMVDNAAYDKVCLFKPIFALIILGNTDI